MWYEMYDENNPNHYYFRVIGEIEDVIVCRNMYGTPFILDKFEFNGAKEVNGDSPLLLVSWGIDQNDCKVTSLNSLQNDDVMNDLYLSLYTKGNVKNYRNLQHRKIGNWVEFLCPITNQWKRKQKIERTY